MSEIILDISANNHKNDLNTVFTMIDMIRAIDSKKHSITFKHQLFWESDKNVVLDHKIFHLAYKYATEKGYKTTASVFDLPSLNFLLRYDIPFIKIACNIDNYWLINEIPRGICVYISCNDESWEHIPENIASLNEKYLLCIPEYPAGKKKYQEVLTKYGDDLMFYFQGISDHTIGLDLYKKYKPLIYECHLKLDSSEGLDSGDWAKTPQQLEEIL